MASPILIQDVRIFDGTKVIHNSGSILLKDGLIFSISSAPPSSLPIDTITISGSGKTIIPGLIDAHVHAGSDSNDLRQALRFGVTTVLDMHNEPEAVKALALAAEEDDSVADFRSACYAGTVDNGWPAPIYSMHDHTGHAASIIASWPKLKSATEAEPFVIKNISLGASYIKLMHESGSSIGFDLPTPSLEIQTALVSAAHKHNLLAVAHALTIPDTLLVLEAGVDGLMHTTYDVPPSVELVAAFKRNNAFLVPTLAAISSGVGRGEKAKLLSEDGRVERLLGEQSKHNLCKCLDFSVPTAKLEYAFESVRMLKDAGIDIVCGSDSSSLALGTALGISTHHEILAYVENVGFTPVEALQTATSIAARRFKLRDRGRIEVGLRADLLLVSGNPTEDITHTLDIVHVWKKGKLQPSLTK